MSTPRRQGGTSHWSPEEMDELERAIVEGARVHLSRRGTEFIVVPREIQSEGSTETLVGTTIAGDRLRFALDEIDRFDVIW